MLVMAIFVGGQSIASDSPLSTEDIFTTGIRYSLGIGVPKDDAEGVRWFKRAARQGHADAQVMLGGAYRLGEGVEQDHAQALYWYQLAAEKHNSAAQMNLAKIYEAGQGVEQDHVKALHYYRLAAEQDHEAAQFELGLMYEAGEGVEQDYAQAVRWYRRAAELGYQKAQYQLGVKYASGQGVIQNFSKAAHWAGLAIEKGFDASDGKLMTFLTDYEVERWGGTNANVTYTAARQHGLLYDASIAYSKAGKKRVYFAYQLYGDPNANPVCDGPSDQPEVIVWHYNDQAVSMHVYCNQPKNGERFVSASPSTSQGHSFVVDLFKRSVGSVDVKISGRKVPFSATGFTAAWSRLSNTAL